MDLMVGAWIPQGNLSVVGSHPFIGLRGGVKYKKLTADVSLGFKFGKAAELYQVYHNDSLWNTDHFFGGYLGLDVGFEALSISNNTFEIVGGIAYEGFDALKVDDPNSNNDISKSLNSLNLNVGIGYRYYFVDRNYFGVDIKYNFVDFQNTGATDLSGDVLSINFLYGFFGNSYKKQRLDELEYKVTK
jgi:hypothetical protein